jgi:hypothetical protein
MTTLTETRSLVLSRAAQRNGGIALPLPERLKGGAAKRVVRPLLSRRSRSTSERAANRSGARPATAMR